MARKKRYPIQLDAEIKVALEKYRKKTGSKTARDAIANLLGIETPIVKPRERLYKTHSGPTPVIIDAAILRCWEHEATSDNARAEIINAVRERMQRPYAARWNHMDELISSMVGGKLRNLC